MGGHGVEALFAEDPVAAEGADGQIADAERGDVLEEVGTLGGFDLELFDSALKISPISQNGHGKKTRIRDQIHRVG